MRVLTETPHFLGLNDRHLTKTPLFQHHKKIPPPIEVRFQEIKITFMVATLSPYPQGCNLIFYIAPLKNTSFVRRLHPCCTNITLIKTCIPAKNRCIPLIFLCIPSKIEGFSIKMRFTVCCLVFCRKKKYNEIKATQGEKCCGTFIKGRS